MNFNDVVMTVGGQKIVGAQALPISYPSMRTKADIEWPNVSLYNECISGERELLLSPKVWWVIKNCFFMKNRPPRGMRR